MLLAHDSPLPGSLPSRFHRVTTDAWEAIWTGFVCLLGVPAGATSIGKLLDRLTPATIPARTAELHGVFWLILIDRATGQRFCCIDPHYFYRAYVGGPYAGNCYLDLVRALGLKAADLDPDTVMELFHYGQMFIGNTFTSAVRRLRHDEVITWNAAGKPVSLPRPVQEMEDPARMTFEEYWAQFVESLRGETLSVDLSGGKDSRLLACLCQAAGLEFDVAMFGCKDFWEFPIARDIAVILDKPFIPTVVELGDIAAAIPRMFRETDGLYDALGFHGQEQLNDDRAARGITLALNGSGGEVFNDHWWLQEFPFYGKRGTNMTLNYDLRIEHLRDWPHEYFAGDMRRRSETWRARMLALLAERYLRPTNTRTYDMIAMEFKTREMGGRFMSAAVDHASPQFMPYMDNDLASIGHHLPVWTRAFNRFHRRQITRLNRRMAKVRTTEYMTLSDEPLDLFCDAFRNVGNKLHRLQRKVNQRLFNKRDFPPSPEHPEVRPVARTLPLTGEIFTLLKDYRIINPDLAFEQVANGHLGRFLTTGLLIRHLEGLD
ncbi:MAG: hypothetical protein ABI743_06150 [bacterium]